MHGAPLTVADSADLRGDGPQSGAVSRSGPFVPATGRLQEEGQSALAGQGDHDTGLITVGDVSGQVAKAREE